MRKTSNCKGCSATVNVSQDEIEEALAVLAKSKNARFVDDETYKLRLNECSNCEFFEYETTCLKCGCIVQIRARLEDASCPDSGNKRW